MEEETKKKSYNSKRENKGEYLASTIYIPRELNNLVEEQIGKQGLSKAAYILKSIRTQVELDSGERGIAGTVPTVDIKQLVEISTDMQTDLKIIKKLLASSC